MEFIPIIAFIIALATVGYLVSKRVRRISANIQLGRPIARHDNMPARLKTMFLIAFGQGKMFHRPLVGLLHLFVYVGFVLVNIEVLEIIIDGVTGKHRIFSNILPTAFYNFLIGFFEFLAVSVIVACVIFLVRRNMLKVERFQKAEIKGWARLDANLILVFEIVLMLAILTMNATDSILQERGDHHYPNVGGKFWFSQYLIPLFASIESNTVLMIIERVAWWFHILGILGFALYVTYSKHLHIFLAFPNTYFSNLEDKGKFVNNAIVTREVNLALGLIQDDGSAPEVVRFGAKDATDLTWKNLMDAYSCTECGRCTASCPANLTGKKLSPRKVMMDTRDRIEELGAYLEKGMSLADALAQGNGLYSDQYISKEELMACTTCNACVEACPINIDPLSIIIQIRQYIAMEESATPPAWTAMLQNIETSFSPWKFAPTDRFNWANDVK
ncbi:MAG: (Fe-S)-binding protein [Bacteroidetes bacterium]|nr:MAG: (Fe-S)-binding protein [Bacteroidota bacterium]